ncbi:MAG: type II CRISPR RNA-guided endonuclease Cas9 [Planctomycetota bacterium]
MKKSAPYVLGLDVGSNSIGWAILGLKNGKPVELLKTGVRVFEAGVEGDIQSGRDESRGVKRRQARQQRRMGERRARRLKKIVLLLQRAALLPEGDIGDPVGRDKALAGLDKQIFARYAASLLHNSPERRALCQLPYFLRSRALTDALEPHELGRALYHLAQRRGFLSNRKAARKEDEDEGKVRAGIAELEKEMAEAGARTLGQYFATLDPEQNRIRSRWTSRKMYVDEFEAIWSAQAAAHPDVLTVELKKNLHKAIFFQRPLKSQKNLIGHCELEPTRRRAPWALLAAQRFRILQTVNNIEVTTPDGEIRALTPDERSQLLGALDTQGSMSFGKVRTLLKLKGHQFNFERGGEKSLKGNTTAAKLVKVFGERWGELSPEERDRIVDDLRSIANPETLERRARKAWGLDEKAAKELAAVQLEPGYCKHSRQAIARLLPLMEEGTRYATARKEIYGDHAAREPEDHLSALADEFPELRNPIVARALNELRKVANGIIGAYGKPQTIRVELARDLKKSRDDRKGITKRNRDNQRGREAAAAKIAAEAGVQNPSRDDVEKILLAEECNWQCPYTGRTISMANLIGSAPQFDVEHIVPFHRCLDNSFINKTLCYHEENRNVKKGRTPFEAYGASAERWAEILGRVKKFRSSAANAKFRRFCTEDVQSIDDFASNQLNDTRDASRRATEYLALLYGGLIDKDGKRRVQASRGQVTYFLRSEWGLNAILGDGDVKTRDDHRHHAVDAVVVALTTPGAVKRLSDAAQRAAQERRKRFGKVKQPWAGFADDVRRSVDEITVSHRSDRKVGGALHEETIYSPPIEEKDENGNVHLVHHVRKPLEGLSAKALGQIVDPNVRSLVLDKLAQLGGGDPKKVFADPANHPRITIKKSPRKGETIPVHSVRIRVPEKPTKIGKKKHRERHVLTGSNHHVEVFEVKDKRGGVKWDGEIVTRYEALRRVRAGEPLVRRDHGPGKKFLFSLCGGDSIQIDEEDGRRGLYIIRTISRITQKGREYIGMEFISINDARKKTDIKAAGEWRTGLLDPLRKLNCQKVVVTPLGEVRRAND